MEQEDRGRRGERERGWWEGEWQVSNLRRVLRVMWSGGKGCVRGAEGEGGGWVFGGVRGAAAGGGQGLESKETKEEGEVHT